MGASKVLTTLIGHRPQAKMVAAITVVALACVWVAVTATISLRVAAVCTFIFAQSAFFADRARRLYGGLAFAVVLVGIAVIA